MRSGCRLATRSVAHPGPWSATKPTTSVDGLWTGPRESAPDRGKSWISPFRYRGRARTLGLARRGYEPLAIRSVLASATGKRPGACVWGAAGTNHQLLAKGGAGNAEGDGVPPGVFVCPPIYGPRPVPTVPAAPGSSPGATARLAGPGGSLAETRASVRAIPHSAVDGLWTRSVEFGGHSRISWTKPFLTPWPA